MNSEPAVFKRILFCGDFTKGAHAGFALLKRLVALQPECELYILHVIPEPEAQFWKSYLYEVEDVDEHARHDIQTRIDQEYGPDTLPGGQFKQEVRIGSECTEILEVAKQHAVDLIIIGGYGDRRIERALSGHLVERVVRKAPCPVLVVPPAR